MRYIALATDYDGTLASEGRVADTTLHALEKIKASGRRLIMVTGRHLSDLQHIFPQTGLFDCLVVENGAVLYYPAKREEKVLCPPPPEEFLSFLREHDVPFSVGRAIVATSVPHDKVVLKAIRTLELELHVVFNKGSVMVLPSGVNKATGLNAAMDGLRLSAHNVVGVGDAENDHAFLVACECGAAVANALPSLKQHADIVTQAPEGAGVAELATQLLEDDLARYDQKLSRHAIVLGTMKENPAEEVCILPCRSSILVAGASASGKSTAVAGLLEQVVEQDYQFCLIDPEGDYQDFGGALALGTPKEKPDPAIVLKALESPKESVIVNLTALPMGERPEYFAALLPRILECRARTARPHWIVIDEAHHLLPPSWSPASSTMPQALGGTILITVHPQHVSPAALNFVNVVMATGQTAREALADFATAIGAEAPSPPHEVPQTGQALVWFNRERRPMAMICTRAPKELRRRHRRNYAEGELSADQSFYFRGPRGKLNLRAKNLMMFIQLAEGVDDATWLFHLRRGDYSRWFQSTIKDADLSRAAMAVEQNRKLSAGESREQIKEAIESRYTAAA